MKTNFLFPYKLKRISGILFTISFALLTLHYLYDGSRNFQIKATVFAILGNKEMSGNRVLFNWIETSVTDELLMLFVIPFGIIYAFSKEKNEDEMVASLRMNSLAWATIVNYIIVLLGYLFIYGLVFFNVLMVAMVSQLLIFILLFRYKMYRFNTASHEE